MADYVINTAVLGRNVMTRQLIFNPVASYVRARFDVLVRRIGFTDDGDEADERTVWGFTAYTGSNTLTTNAGQVLYVTITGTTDAVVSVYDDAAKTSKVAEGTESTRSTGSAVTLAEENSSGLSGTVTLADGCTNDDFTVTIEDYHDRYDGSVDGAASNIIGIDNGLATDFTTTTEPTSTENRDIMNLVYQADSVKQDELGMDNVADHLTRQVFIDQAKIANITLI